MKGVRLVQWVFAAVGTVLLLSALLVVRGTQTFIARAVKVRGTVVENIHMTDDEGSGTYHARFRFRTLDGRSFTVTSRNGTNPPSFRPGETIEVLYDDTDPSGAVIHTFWQMWVAPAILGILGSVFLLVAGIIWFVGFHGKQKAAWLRANGQRIQAQVQRIELNGSVEMNGNNAYRLACQWLNPATNRMHVFKSANLWYDPAPFMAGRGVVDVWIDPNNPGKYLVDTDFLPKLAN